MRVGKRRLDVFALCVACNNERKGWLEDIEEVCAIWRIFAQHSEVEQMLFADNSKEQRKFMLARVQGICR